MMSKKAYCYFHIYKRMGTIRLPHEVCESIFAGKIYKEKKRKTPGKV